MASVKISDLPSLTSPKTNDVFIINDTAANETKKITQTNLFYQQATFKPTPSLLLYTTSGGSTLATCTLEVVRLCPRLFRVWCSVSGYTSTLASESEFVIPVNFPAVMAGTGVLNSLVLNNTTYEYTQVWVNGKVSGNNTTGLVLYGMYKSTDGNNYSTTVKFKANSVAHISFSMAAVLWGTSDFNVSDITLP